MLRSLHLLNDAQQQSFSLTGHLKGSQRSRQQCPGIVAFLMRSFNLMDKQSLLDLIMESLLLCQSSC